MGNLTPKEQEGLEERLETSSSVNRNLGLFFAGFLIYIAITIGGTTDLMLLLPDSTVPLPLLQLELPLMGFYIVVPLLELMMHLNLLINLLAHSRKLNQWITINEGRNDTVLHPFLFNYYRVAPKGDFSRFLAGILVEVVAYYLPMLALLIFLARFSDYQNLEISFWHFALFTIDAIFVYYFRQAVRDSKNHLPNRQLSQYFLQNGLLPFWILWAPFKMLGRISNLQFISWIGPFFVRNSTRKGKHLRMFTSGLIFWLVLLWGTYFIWITHNVCNENQWVSFVPYMQASTIPEFMKPRITVHDKVVTGNSPSPTIIAQYLAMGKKSEEAWLEFSDGINLQGRGLRFADLQNCKIYKADLRNGAKLDAADLSYSVIQQANMFNISMNQSILVNAQMQGANLTEASLIGARLNWTKLQGADLILAELRNADLSGAQMHGADLTNVQMEGANLSDAQMQLTILRDANMRGTNLSNANMTGANLSNVQLEDANLTWALLQSANLTSAKMNRAVLSCSNIHGTILKNISSDNCLAAFLDTIKTPNWLKLNDELTNLVPNSNATGQNVRQRTQQNLLSAQKRVFILGEIPQLDEIKYLESRIKIICDSTYPLSLLSSDSLDSPDYVKLRQRMNCALIWYINNSCPERWLKLNWYVDDSQCNHNNSPS